MVAEPVTLGWQVADWIETLLCHGPGDVQGDPIELDPEFLAVLVRAYELSKDGRRKVRRYILSRAKGRAKSELAGMVVCAEALGPVRFDHWAEEGEVSSWGYQFDRGEPVGRPPTYPFIRCLATEETQSGNTYDNVHFMLSDAVSEGRLDKRVDVGLTRTFLPGGGEIRPSTASNSAKDGGKETFAVFDETHLYDLPELRRMHGTVRRNLRKRKDAQPWSLETTTMYEAGAESVAETTHRSLSGIRPPADVVFDHREGSDPEGFDWDNDDALLAALHEAYGPAAGWMDLPGILAEIRDPETEKSDAIRFFLNRASSTAADFISLAEWDKLKVAVELQPKDVICVGFDGSRGGDATGIVGVRASDGLTVPLGIWERPQGDKAWQLPRSEIHERVAEVFTTYRVVRWYGDPRYWETDHDAWTHQYGSPPVMELPQSSSRLHGAASRVVTQVRATLAGEEIDDMPGIHHNGDHHFRAHVGNARRERFGGRGSMDGRWRLAKKAPERHIDLAVAMTFAHEALGDAIKAGEIVEEVFTPFGWT